MCKTVEVDILYASDQWCYLKSIHLIYYAVGTDYNFIFF